MSTTLFFSVLIWIGSSRLTCFGPSLQPQFCQFWAACTFGLPTKKTRKVTAHKKQLLLVSHFFLCCLLLFSLCAFLHLVVKVHTLVLVSATKSLLRTSPLAGTSRTGAVTIYIEYIILSICLSGSIKAYWRYYKFLTKILIPTR